MTVDTMQVTSVLSPAAERGPWLGMRLVINLGDCDPAKIRDRVALQHFVAQLVKTINMRAYGRPLCKRFGTGELAGETIVQLIETSNIDVHCFDYNGGTLLHICSCRAFDTGIALAFVAEFFETDLWEATVLPCHIPQRKAHP